MKRVSIAVCLLLAAVGAVSGGVIYVTPSGTGTGTNWADAASLTNALTIANDGDELWISQGAYTNPAGMGSTNNAFLVSTNNLTLYGGFTTSMSSLSERDWDAYPALLDGENTQRVMTVTGSGVALDGLVITNGYGPDQADSGGGIYKSSASAITVANCKFLDNEMFWASTRYGGGGYFKNGSVTISNCLFNNRTDNNSDVRYRKGLGFYAEDATVTVVDSLFTNNTCPSAAYYNWGVAFYVHGGSISVSDTVFADNSPSRGTWGSGGGGVVALSDLAVGGFTNCTFINNTVQVQQDDPSAGIFAEAAGGGPTIHVFECTFTNLEAGVGAAITVEAGAVTVENSTFIDCDARVDGGAFYVKAGTLALTNCTITGCDATDEGGAAYVEAGTLNLANSILWANTAVTWGNDIVNAAGGSGSIDYCLLSGDEDETDIIYDASGGNLTINNVFSQDPLFASATDVHLKSPTGRWTGSWDTSDTHPHSPCIDAADPTAGVGSEVTPNGFRVNLGRYGNTAEASKSPANAPVVENRTFTVNVNQATLRGELVDVETIADVRIYYSTSSSPTNTDSYASRAAPQQTGTVFSVSVTGLDYDETYYYRGFATNGYGYDWAGAISNFTTGSEPPGGGANIIHVDTNAVSGGETGDNWFNAFTSFKDACDAIDGSKTQMWIASGTYIDPSEATIAGSVSVYGGFNGSETTLSARDPDANQVFLDGNDLHRVIKVTAGPTLLDGVTVQNGYGPNQAASGGGIHKDGAFALTLVNCRIVDNLPYQANGMYGGGAYFKDGTVVITNCYFNNPFVYAGDIRYRRGYGFYAQNADTTVIDSVFTNHRDTTVGYYNQGAAINVYGGSLSVTDTDFLDNNVTRCHADEDGGGGAVYIQGNAEAAFTNCLFRGNEVQNTGANDNPGGAIGIWNTASVTVRLDHCTFMDNAATYGGAIYMLDGNLVLEHCTMADNYARTVGAKLGQGGAIYVADGNVTIHNSILWTNRADERGSDIANEGGVSVDINYNNLSGDPDDGDTYVWDLASTVSETNNLWIDPRFASDFDDLHLKSTEGRWDPVGETWTTDAESSLLIDAGDPGGPLTYTNEPTPNGARANLGVYGNTWQASKTAPIAAPVVTNIGHGLTHNYVTITGELVVADTTADVYIYYGKTDWVWDGYIQPSPASQEDGVPFSATKGDLDYSQTYYYRCYATNASGDSWASNVISFTTGSEPAGGPDTVIHVDSDAAGSQSGYTWFDACHTVQDALDKVQGTTNEIWIAYTSDPNNGAITIATNVSIYGGFDGTENLRNERTSNRTVLDGNYPTDSRRVMSITAGTVLLDGLVVSNGYHPDDNAAGIGLNASGYDSLTIQDCTFVANHMRKSGQDGGGAYLSGGAAVISNCVFNNHLQYSWHHWGGALYAQDVALTVIDSVFSNHTYAGGAIYYNEGGAVALNGGTLDMSGCTFVGNNAPKGHAVPALGHQSGGGAVFMIGQAIAEFSNCVFLDNDCEASGTHQAPGGAFKVEGAGTTATVVNCTIADSDAYHGGALAAVEGGEIVLKNTILWNNTATGNGQEMYSRGSGSAITSRYSSVSGTSSIYAYTMDSGSVSWGPGILAADPLFASATDLHLKSETGRWDPSTETWVQDAEFSPCIDAGDPEDYYKKEPLPHGKRLNLGAYGNTPYASMSTPPPGSLMILR